MKHLDLRKYRINTFASLLVTINKTAENNELIATKMKIVNVIRYFLRSKCFIVEINYTRYNNIIK
jgi:hypothetical protein